MSKIRMKKKDILYNNSRLVKHIELALQFIKDSFDDLEPEIFYYFNDEQYSCYELNAFALELMFLCEYDIRAKQLKCGTGIFIKIQTTWNS